MIHVYEGKKRKRKRNRGREEGISIYVINDREIFTNFLSETTTILNMLLMD